MRKVSEDCADTDPTRKAVQKIFLKLTNEHDYSKVSFTSISCYLHQQNFVVCQSECWHIINQHKYVEYSRQFVFINLRDTRRVNLTAAGEAGEEMARTQNFADTYWNRENDDNYRTVVARFDSGELRLPRDPRHVCLYDFASSYSTKWEYSGRLVVVVPTPQYKKIPKQFCGEESELNKYHVDYCRTQLLLYKPGCTPDTVLERTDGQADGEQAGPFEDTHAALLHFVETDDHCPPEVRRSFLNFLKKAEEDEQAAAEAAENGMNMGGEGQQDNDMEFEPLVHSQPDNEDDFIFEDIDRALAEIGVENFDEMDDEEIVMNQADAADLPLAESNNTDRLILVAAGEDPRRLMTSLEEFKRERPIEQVTERIDMATLNDDQTLLKDTIMAKLEKKEQFLGDLTGGAGTGKSYGIKAIQQDVKDKYGEGAIRIAAPTGCAAVQFPNGSTLHSLLRIFPVKKGRKGKRETLDGPELKEIQEKLGTMLLLVIDEKVGIFFLYLWTLVSIFYYTRA